MHALCVPFRPAPFRPPSAPLPPTRAQIIGSPPFLAPECVLQAPGTPASDIWALGVTLHQCHRGQNLFLVDGDCSLGSIFTKILCSKTKGLPGGALAGMSAPLAACVQQLLQFAAGARPTAAAAGGLEFFAEVRESALFEPAPRSPRSPRSPPRSPRPAALLPPLPQLAL
jgi:serine/threonine protein kinase